jgi:DNA-binding CsgD family transcriptional regulator
MLRLSELTPRLQLVLAGRTNKAIAAEFRITEKTVEFHLNNMYAKIEVQNRLMVSPWALQQGKKVEAREFPNSTK